MTRPSFNIVTSLPLELLQLILSGITSDHDMLNCALVHSTWMHSSLKQLWRDLWIWTNEDAERISESQALGRYRTAHIAVGSAYCDERSSEVRRMSVSWKTSKSIEKILRACPLLEELVMQHTLCCVPDTVFAEIPLLALRRLTLNCSFDVTSASAEAEAPCSHSLPLPLLTSLTIDIDRQPFEDDRVPQPGRLYAVQNLLAPSSSDGSTPPITELKIVGAVADLLPSFLPFGPALTSLSISVSSFAALATEFQPLFSSPFLDTLEILYHRRILASEICDHLDWVLPLCLNNLTELQLGIWQHGCDWRLLKRLSEFLTEFGCPKLEVLELNGIDLEQVRGWKSGNELIDLIIKKDICSQSLCEV